MKYFLPTMIILASCASPWFKIAEDIVVGEAAVIENVMSDEAGIPHPKPTVNVIKKSF
jgi:hypothetical protein